MKFNRLVQQALVWLLMFGLLACSPSQDEKPQQSTPDGSIVLMLTETEPEVDPYQTRIIINKNFVRFDDGLASNDFVLFDRKTGVIYSSSAETKRIFVIKPKNNSIVPPIKIEITTNNNDDIGAPSVAGNQLRSWVMSANGKVCNELIVVPNFLTEAVKALKEYHFQLAFEQAATLHKIPTELQDACDIAMNVMAPDWALSKGLPVNEKHYTGRVRTLRDYKEGYKADPSLFELPKDYPQFSREDLSAN